MIELTRWQMFGTLSDASELCSPWEWWWVVVWSPSVYYYSHSLAELKVTARVVVVVWRSCLYYYCDITTIQSNLKLFRMSFDIWILSFKLRSTFLKLSVNFKYFKSSVLVLCVYVQLQISSHRNWLFDLRETHASSSARRDWLTDWLKCVAAILRMINHRNGL